jgi:hypothetical protein
VGTVAPHLSVRLRSENMSITIALATVVSVRNLTTPQALDDPAAAAFTRSQVIVRPSWRVHYTDFRDPFFETTIHQL